MIESVMIMGGVSSWTIRPFAVSAFLASSVTSSFFILFARYAWRLIQKSRNTPYFPLALFMGIPAWEPFGFIIVFGAFDVSLPNCIVTLGLLNMLNNSLEQWKTANPEAHIPPSKQRPPYSTPGAARWQAMS